MRNYFADTSLVFAVIVGLAGIVTVIKNPTYGLITLLVAFLLFTFSYMVKRY